MTPTRDPFSGKIRFHVTLLVGVLFIVGAMTAAIVGTILAVADMTARDDAATQFTITSSAVRERTRAMLQPAFDLASIAAFMPGVDDPVTGAGADHPAAQIFVPVLLENPALYSAYVGFSDGSFLQVIHVDGDQAVRNAHDAPVDTEIILRQIGSDRDGRFEKWTFLDARGGTINTGRDGAVSYDPRSRPWYSAAREVSAASAASDAAASANDGAAGNDAATANDAGGLALSDPYTFSSSGLPGVTVSREIPGGRGVVGVDITTFELSAFLADQSFSPGGGSALLTGNRRLIAADPSVAPFLGVLGSDEGGIALPATSERVASQGEVAGWLYMTSRWNGAADRKLIILTAAPLTDFLAGAAEMRRKILMIAAIVLVVIVPIVAAFAHRLAKTLRRLAEDAERIGNLDFSGELGIATPIYEFQRLGDAFTIMKQTIADRTAALRLALEKLEMLVDMAIAMSAEYDLDRLSEMILVGAKRLTHADGGSLYLANEERDALDFMIVLNDSLGFQQGGSSGTPIEMRPVPLYDENGDENRHNVVTHAFHAGETVDIADAYDATEFDFSGTRVFDGETGYRSQSFLTVPLKPRGGGDVMGALQLINAIDPDTGAIVPFPDNFREFVVALSSAAAVAVQNWKLMQQQKRVFDDLVRFVGTAIDEKSPYTARHSARVPEVALALAGAAQDATSGQFADFSFTPLQWREFEVAAWLHDCGKITTPEHVIDKATKLETIYNRIHEIRTRFEVLLRDARIEYLNQVADGIDDEAAAATLAEREAALFDDFAFVAECNRGTEFMEDSAIERLRRIADRRWTRHFDDRLGLSVAEEAQFDGAGSVRSGETRLKEERLLDDRPEHITERDNWKQERYSAHGFRFDIPERADNRGEIYNLSIRRGTLTEEERFKINEHVAQTIMMLEQIRFPAELRRVPQFAGEHHEMLDGSGYPRRFTKEDLSLPSRILAFADIFEALTSTDRPYRRPMKLSEAIEILSGMAHAGKVDGDLFRLFLSSGVYRAYALANMHPAQIDTVDLARYLGVPEKK